MNMYWSQQEVFLMGVLSLDFERLKNKPIMPDGEWWYYFNSSDEDELRKQFRRYKKAGYIEFDEIPVLVTYANSPPDPDDEINFRPLPTAFVIRQVHHNKVTDDLTEYLEKWRNNKLSANTDHKPDDYEYQHKKLVTALGQTYRRQKQPHIDITDVFGDTQSATSYELPFWEVVLEPYFVSLQYTIGRIDYAMDGHGKPFVSIKKITGSKMQRSITLAANSAPPISDEEPEELEHRGLRLKRDGLAEYNGIEIKLEGEETAALRVLLERPEELRLREDIGVELTPKNNEPKNMAKLISSLRGKLKVVIGYNCIENKFGQGWALKIRLTE